MVGRFLEHARIYYFQNGGDDECYIGSADALARNLNSRVEILVPVEGPALREELRDLIEVQLADRRSTREMRSDGSYVPRTADPEGDARSAQQIMIQSHERRFKRSTRLRRRKPRGIDRRHPG